MPTIRVTKRRRLEQPDHRAYKGGAPVHVKDVGKAIFDTENVLGGNYFVLGSSTHNPEWKEGPAVSIGITKQPGSQRR